MTQPLIDLPEGFDPFDLEPIVLPHSELVAEFFASIASLAQAEINYLIERGVPPLALCRDPGEDGWLVGRAYVRFDEGGLFDFAAETDKGAVKALCVVARDVSGWPVDVVAWAPKEDRVAAHYGRVALLGEQRVCAITLDDEPIAVHKSVAGWLGGERRGVVVVDEKNAWRALEGVEVVAEDLEHGKRLRKILTPPPARIFVQQQEAA